MLNGNFQQRGGKVGGDFESGCGSKKIGKGDVDVGKGVGQGHIYLSLFFGWSRSYIFVSILWLVKVIYICPYFYYQYVIYLFVDHNDVT